MISKQRLLPALACAAVVSAGMTKTADAAVILSTDFTGMTISGTDPNTANGISWTENGLTSLGSLTLENVIANQNDGELFDYATGLTTAAGFFGGNTNLSRSPSDGQWGTTVTVTVGSAEATLDDVVIDLVYGNNSGGANTGGHTTKITVTVLDDLGATVDSASVSNFTQGNGRTLTFASPLTLDANETYSVSFLVESDSGSGHYAAFDSLAFNGEVVPEPGSLALLGLGGLMMLKRRRR